MDPGRPHRPRGRLSSTDPEKGYPDTGVVVDLGPARDFTGTKVAGSRNLAENIRITNGSQATMPGTHPLSSPANCDYGLGVAGGWYMTGKPDAWNGKTLTAAQIHSDFAGSRAGELASAPRRRARAACWAGGASGEAAARDGSTARSEC